MTPLVQLRGLTKHFPVGTVLWGTPKRVVHAVALAHTLGDGDVQRRFTADGVVRTHRQRCTLARGRGERCRVFAAFAIEHGEVLSGLHAQHLHQVAKGFVG